VDKDLTKSGVGVKDWAGTLTEATSTVMALSSAVTTAKGIIDVFNQPDVSGWDIFSTVLSGIAGGIVPAVV
jgi:hypothetical protein